MPSSVTLPVQQIDINAVLRANGASNPSQFVQMGSTTFFVATNDQNGEELWKTDGTEAGTVLVRDIKPGAGSSVVRELTNVNGALFFRASEESANYELWKSDGTTDGTVKVKEIRNTGVQSFPTSLTEFNGKLLFGANDGFVGSELWISDGTEIGTTQIKDIVAGFNGGSPSRAVVINGIAYFAANNSNVAINGFDRELWRTDGTQAGTYLVADINPGVVGSQPDQLLNINGTLFFTANDGANGVELWKSDGTAAGTVMVKNISASGSSAPTDLTSLNGLLYFSAEGDGLGRELWKTDGTDAGTVLVKDVNPAGSSAARSLVSSNGVLFFVANDGTHGDELWSSDGTAGGTALVKDILPGSSSSNPSNLTVMNNKLYFRANDGVSGDELWVSDGSSGGTTQVLDIASGSGGSTPGSLFNANGILLFQANDGVHGNELWKSDGTAAGTVLVRDLRPPQSPSNPQFLTNINGAIFFQADDGVHGPELWKSDGTIGGTSLVADIQPGSTGSAPQFLTEFNGQLFFLADNGTNGLEIWKSDGTAAGTVLLKDIRSGSANGITVVPPLNVFQISNGTLYFVANDGVIGTELWKTDGTASGTVPVKDIRSGLLSSGPRYLTDVNGTLFFRASDGPSGYELWKTDGTSSGTVLVKNINTNFYQGSNPTRLTNSNGTLFFQITTGTSEEVLYKSDGTDSGTVPLATFGSSQGPRLLTPVNGTVFFRASDNTNGYELWKSDGTVAGTTIVRDIAPGNQNSYVTNLRNVNGTLYFLATNNAGSAGQELWKSDGTNAGTVQVADLIPGDVVPGVPKMQLLASRGNRLFFSAPGREGSGVELWTTDGTSSGTIRVSDINPGPASSNIGGALIVDGMVYFAADNGRGAELWAANINFAPSAVTLNNSTVSLSEGTATPRKVADIVVTDDGLGTNSLSLSGADAASFEIVGTELRLKAGVVLDFETRASYSVKVNVDDTSLGNTPDAFVDYTLTINDVNEAPTAVQLQNTVTSLAENTSTATRVKVADIVITDDALGTETLGLTGADSASFEIDAGVLYLKQGVVLNFEAKSSYSTTVTVSDTSLGSSLTTNFTLNLTDVNEGDLGLLTDSDTDNNLVDENSPIGTTVGVTALAVDPDGTDTVTYELAGGEGKFAIDPNTGVVTVAGALDFETESSYIVAILATSSDGTQTADSFIIDVANVIEPPELKLSRTTINERNMKKAVVGNFSVNDVDNSSLTYTLVKGTGGIDNKSFLIVGNQLQAKRIFNFEKKSVYSIRVLVTGPGGLSQVKNFTINVTNVNERPTSITLTNLAVQQQQPVGTVVGLLAAVDPDAGNTHTFLLSGANPDNASFEIVGNQLRTTAVFDYALKRSYIIRIRAVDQGSFSYERQFTIRVLV